jgi:hypothetical protein
MPINISKDALSAIKIGESDLVKAIVGINEIFPNEASITAAAFNNAGSGITNAAQNQAYTVAGDIGSSFTLQGALGATPPSGTQSLSTSPTSYQVAIGANTACAAPLRYPAVTIVKQGNTVFDPVGLATTSTITQAAGPSNVSNVTTITMSSTGSGPTVNIGGQLRWAVGAVLTTTFSVTTNYTLGSITMSVDGDGGSYYSGQFFSIGNNGISPQAWNSSNAAQVNWTTGNSSLNGMNGSVTYTYNGYNGGGNAVAMRSTISLGGINCEIPTVTSASTIAYP